MRCEPFDVAPWPVSQGWGSGRFSGSGWERRSRRQLERPPESAKGGGSAMLRLRAIGTMAEGRGRLPAHRRPNAPVFAGLRCGAEHWFGVARRGAEAHSSPTPGLYDAKSESTITAFRRHFRPARVVGSPILRPSQPCASSSKYCQRRKAVNCSPCAAAAWHYSKRHSSHIAAVGPGFADCPAFLQKAKI
jgi:hypothetical protein